MNYERHVNAVIEYIGKHLDEKLTLQQLSRIDYSRLPPLYAEDP
ncbi:hypothetical protein [Legionella sp. W05-934-2]|jgi:YesN/AraC family two-component response regulator